MKHCELKTLQVRPQGGFGGVFDCLIKGGLLVDGTGAPATIGSVGIKDGRIAAVGQVDEGSRRVIDAEGRVIAPGFIDIHTHYDAQIMWDPATAPSSLHGVTTVVGGNCGYSLAPVNDPSAAYVMGMLASVEGIPAESLAAALDFNWQSFSDWLARLDGRIAVNAGFLVGHSTVRRLAMGDEWQLSPTPAQTALMSELVDQSLREGALGFSSSWGDFHSDHDGNPVPSRYAEPDELLTLAAVLARHPGTVLEFNPSSAPAFPDRAIEVMSSMSAVSGRPLNWNLLTAGDEPDDFANQARLSASDHAAKAGGAVVALTMPMASRARVNLLTTIAYNTIPSWLGVLSLPLEARMAALTDPWTRQVLAEDARRVRAPRRTMLDFAGMSVESTFSPELKVFEGRSVADLAVERDCTPFDAFVDLSVEDRLQASFRVAAVGDDDLSWRRRVEYWNDARVMIGGSDAGAHLDALDTFSLTTTLIGPTVRERQLLSLEDAVHKVTGAPARLYGLKGRGRIAKGWYADLVIFDPETVGPGPVSLRDDMPAGGRRLYGEAVGIDRVLVNGTEVVVAGRETGDTPGTVLRSGRDQQAAWGDAP
jgi:N-acyl-D-aspartate/D-glutamate deacylase